MNEPKQQRSQDTFDRILKAAAECVAELGYSKTSTAIIANRAGVSKGGLFGRFPNKTVLMSSLLIEMEQRARAKYLAPSSQDIKRRTLEERARSMIESYLEFTQSKEGRAIWAIWNETATDVALREALRDQISSDIIAGDLHLAFPECPESPSLRFLSEMFYESIDRIAFDELVTDSAPREEKIIYLSELLAREIRGLCES